MWRRNNNEAITGKEIRVTALWKRAQGKKWRQ